MFLAWLFNTPRIGTLMSDSDVELRRLVNALPQYEEQIRYWESQLDAISNVKTDIFQAQDTINGMIKSDKSNEMLVRVVHNTSILATIKDMDRVLVGIGSRVYMETTREDSLNRLNKRLDDLNTATQNYQNNLVKTQQEYTSIREKIESLQGVQ